MLDAALRLGFAAPHACLQASCGICRGRVCAGELRYPDGVRPYGLFEQEIADGYVLLCLAQPCRDARIDWPGVRAPGVFPVTKISCPVQSVTALTDDTWRVVLQRPAHAPGDFHAGQYLQLLMADGSERAFSIASAPEQRESLELHIRVVPGHNAALEVLRHLQTRSLVTLRLPFGNGRLPDNDRPLLMIAGGTGFAPMKALIESSLARDEQRELWLFWGAANPASLYWHEPLQALAQQHHRLHYVPVLSQADADWPGLRGYPHQAALDLFVELSAFDIFVSGSEPMARTVYREFRAVGAVDAHFHCDWIDLLRAQGAL